MKKIRVRTELILIYIKTTKMTNVEFCKKCGIKEESLNKLLYKNETCCKMTMWKIADFLHLRYKQLFKIENNYNRDKDI